MSAIQTRLCHSKTWRLGWTRVYSVWQLTAAAVVLGVRSQPSAHAEAVQERAARDLAASEAVAAALAPEHPPAVWIPVVGNLPVSPDALADAMGTNNLTYLLMTADWLDQLDPGVYEWDFAPNVTAMALYLSEHHTLVRSADIADLIGVRQDDGSILGRFKVATGYGLNATFLFAATHADDDFTIHHLAIARKGSDDISQAFTVFDRVARKDDAAITPEDEGRFEMRPAWSEPAEGRTHAVIVGSDQAVWLGAKVELSGGHVAGAEVVEGWEGAPAVMIAFTDEGRKRFADVTRQYAAAIDEGVRLAIIVDGRVLSAPTVREEIRGGRALITGAFTREEAERIAAGLTSSEEAVAETVSWPVPAPLDMAKAQEEVRTRYAAAAPEIQEYILWTARTFGPGGMWLNEDALAVLSREQREAKVHYLAKLFQEAEYGRHLCSSLSEASAIKDERLVPGLMNVAGYHREDANYDCRPKWIAVAALARQNSDSAVPLLIDLVDHGNQNTRKWARAALARKLGQDLGGDKAAWEELWKRIEAGRSSFVDP